MSSAVETVLHSTFRIKHVGIVPRLLIMVAIFNFMLLSAEKTTATVISRAVNSRPEFQDGREAHWA